MESQFHASVPAPLTFQRPSGTVSRCPFHDGPLTLDGLLAELSAEESAAMDLALDLRSAMRAGGDAGRCVQLALKLRHALDGSHYLAFYRVRLWLQRMIVVQVRAWRGADWRTYPLPLNCARIDEIEHVCLATWANDTLEANPDWAQVRFAFRTSAGATAATAVA